MVPILRAGLIPLDLAHTVLPAMVTYHVGLCRDEETLQVCNFYGHNIAANGSNLQRNVARDTFYGRWVTPHTRSSSTSH